MNDKQQIEEMAKNMANCDTTCNECFEQLESVMTMKIKERENHCQAYHYAKRLYEQNYRKLPENAVVLTREEYEKLCHLAYFGYDDVYNKARKETARECRNFVKKWVGNSEEGLGFLFDFEDFIAKQYGVEVEE